MNAITQPSAYDDYTRLRKAAAQARMRWVMSHKNADEIDLELDGEVNQILAAKSVGKGLLDI